MDKKEAKWIVKQMRKMYSDDRTILEIAKNSYHDRIISWDELILICNEIHYEFYDSFVEKESKSYVVNDNNLKSVLNQINKQKKCLL